MTVGEVAYLRVALRESLDNFATRMDAILARLEAELPHADPDDPDLMAALARVQGMDLRPERGRAKDLVRIRRLTKGLDKALR